MIIKDNPLLIIVNNNPLLMMTKNKSLLTIVNFVNDHLVRVSNVIDYSLMRNYMQLHIIIFIPCNFAELCIIGKIFISQNYVMITRNKQNYNYA